MTSIGAFDIIHLHLLTVLSVKGVYFNSPEGKIMKRIVLLICAVCICLGFTGCNTKKELEAFKAAEEQGRINALNYVREKYGFEPEVLNVQGEYVEPDLFPGYYDPSGPVEVTMRHEGKTFLVVITGTEASTDGEDDYQIDEITEAIKLRVQEVFSEYCDYIDTDTERGWGRYHTFYDGTNIEEVMAAERHADCYVTAANMDLRNLDTVALMGELHASHVEIVNFSDLNAYQSRAHFVSADFLPDYVLKHGVYLQDYIEIEYDGSKKYAEVEKAQCGDLMVVLQEATYCDVEQTQVDLHQWKTELQLGENQKVYRTYAIDTDASAIGLALSRSPLEEEGASNVCFFAGEWAYKDKISYYRTPVFVDEIWYYTDAIDLPSGKKQLIYCFLETV